MSLSGNLGFVSLDEVLRLLTRSEQRGSVDVRGEGVRGRIFVTEGGVALATTSDDQSLRSHLIKSGLVDEIYMQSVESGEQSLGANGENTSQLVALIREMTVESLYQLGLNGDGFEVNQGDESTYGSPQTFDLEGLLEDTRHRLNEWADVSRTVSDLDSVLTFAHDIGDRDDVAIDRDSWRVLSYLGSGSSVTQLASRLGTTEFWTARAAARLVEKDLLEIDAVQDTEIPDEAPAEPVVETESDPDASWWEEPKDEEPEDAFGMPEAEPVTSDEMDDDASTEDESSIPAIDAVEDESADGPSSEEDPVTDDEPSGIPALAEEAGTDTAEVEEDTEAFLEKVFSELESTPESEQAPEEGYGLLRRRRMGAIRDAANDS